MKKETTSKLKQILENRVETPLQETIPVKSRAHDNESNYNLWMPKERLRFLRRKAFEEETTIKDLINSALLEQYGI